MGGADGGVGSRWTTIKIYTYPVRAEGETHRRLPMPAKQQLPWLSLPIVLSNVESFLMPLDDWRSIVPPPHFKGQMRLEYEARTNDASSLSEKLIFLAIQ
jgi:hypothetical protein